MIQLTAIAARHKSLDDDLLVHLDRPEILDAQVRRDGVFRVEPACLAHNFVQQHGDDSTVKKSRAALVFLAEVKTSDDTLARVILFKGKLHSARVCPSAPEACVFRLGIKFHFAPGSASLVKTRSTGFSLCSLNPASPNDTQTKVCATKTSRHLLMTDPG